MKKINLKFDSPAIIKNAHFFALMIGLIFVSLVFFFLYNNFYKTMIILGEVVVIKSDASTQNVDIDELDEVISIIENKTKKEKEDINETIEE